jgi:UDP-N-acetyl-2-amino-2-deoxyglucuronate dehydrogenase
MKSYRAAIVGCGAISGVHAAALKENGIELCAVCDIKSERAAAMSVKTGAAAYTELDNMLNNENIDVLHICTPHFLHLSMAETALIRGINVVLEKPPVMNMNEFQRLSAAANSKNVQICVCFQNRFNATTRHAKQLIDSGRYGALLGARGIVTWHRRGDYYTESDWRGRYNTEGGGVLINQALHTLDLLGEFLGEPTDVRAVCANLSHSEIETEDTVCAEIDYGKKSAVFYSTVSACKSPDAEIMLFCERANINLSFRACAVYPKDGRAEIFSVGDITPGKSCWGSSHSELIGKFYSSLDGTGTEQNPCPLESCRQTMETLCRIYDGNLITVDRKE